MPHNLGADQAAYVITAPEVNDFLSNWSGDSVYDTMSLDVRFDYLNNGFEQIFIRAGNEDSFVVPEPTTIVLLGFGLVGLACYGRKRK